MTVSTSHAVGTAGRELVVPAEAVLAAALLGSALVHASVVEEHLQQWSPAGAFFLGLVLVETLLAVCVWRAWGRLTAYAVALTGTATVGVWTLSRTLGMPIGPPDFRTPEAVGIPDLACCSLELLTVVLAAAYLVRGRPATVAALGRGRLVRAAGGVVTLAVVLGVTGWGMGWWPGADNDDGHRSHSHAVLSLSR